MLKTLISTLTLMSAAGIANTQPFPAPPTEAYTPPAASSCTNQTLHVYFPAGTSALTPASRTILQAAKARLDGCVLGQVSLNASAADARSEIEAESLTTARLEIVSQALATYQLDGMQLKSSADAPKPTGSVWSPMDRKVEIRVAAWSPEIS